MNLSHRDIEIINNLAKVLEEKLPSEEGFPSPIERILMLLLGSLCGISFFLLLVAITFFLLPRSGARLPASEIWLTALGEAAILIYCSYYFRLRTQKESLGDNMSGPPFVDVLTSAILFLPDMAFQMWKKALFPGQGSREFCSKVAAATVFLIAKEKFISTDFPMEKKLKGFITLAEEKLVETTVKFLLKRSVIKAKKSLSPQGFEIETIFLDSLGNQLAKRFDLNSKEN